MRQLRCAIYTRKSTEEGLDQDFNSLDGQREACAAFIASQVGEGWQAIPTRYDDGGFSGGNMERPALRRLLEDIEAGRIQIIVTYKVDRLSRSLSDFAKLVDVFDRHEVSFVSVTQQFNTTTSMGRLTLNVLLSFAQFEREVTAERIRDKIAASMKKGMWMGGLVPLGYDAVDRKLVVNEKESETVKELFRLYLQLALHPELAGKPRDVPARLHPLDRVQLELSAERPSLAFRHQSLLRKNCHLKPRVSTGGRPSRKRPGKARFSGGSPIPIFSVCVFGREEVDMDEDRKPRARYGEAFWRAHHEAWKRSDLNQREYCESQGIALKAFGNWRAKFKAEPQPPAPRLLYRRGRVSHTLSHRLSHSLSHVTYPSPAAAPDLIVPPARAGHRRRFTEAERNQMLAEAAKPGATVSEVARRYGIDRRVLCRWRREAAATPGFVDVVIIDAPDGDEGDAS